MKEPRLRRYKDSAFAAFVLALAASIAVHLPVYEELGQFAEWLRARDAEEAKHATPSEVEFEFNAPEPPPPVGEKRRDQARAKPEAKQPRVKQFEEKQVEVEPAKVEPPPQEQQAKQSPPPEPEPNKQAIQQHATNPSESPQNAKFISEQNNKVDEETIARIRSYQRDDETPRSGKPVAPSTNPEEGNANELDVADVRHMRGTIERTATPDEIPRDPTAKPSTAPQVARSTPKSTGVARDPAVANDQRGRLVVVDDGMGSFTVARRTVGSATTARPGDPAKLVPSYAQYEAMYGDELTDSLRDAQVAQRRSRNPGSSRGVRWEEFRSAIENFVPGVKPGNQTALNAAASPFATYLHEVHIRIHREYADRYLRSLPAFSASPYADVSLRTSLEIVLNKDGSVDSIGIVRSSGLMPFDYGAYNSVMRGQPYPVPPEEILSYNNKVYFHWDFYRNERQCGTFNAEPFILSGPNRPVRGQERSAVPTRAKPTRPT